MAEHVKEVDEPRRQPELPAGWVVRCQICRTVHRPEDSILCRVCGEPVIVWGWAP